MKRFFKKGISLLLSVALILVTMGVVNVSANAKSVEATTDSYRSRFLNMWNKIHDPANGYFSEEGIPYHSVETLMCEAPDYGHETTSEAFSYYIWLEAMYGNLTGDWSSFKTAWDTTEKYMIPSDKDQLETSMSKYNPSKPATYAPEQDLPNDYPSQLDSNKPVGVDPISDDLSSTYNTSTMYGMHWLLDVDNWYGYGQREDGTSRPSYINTFQRGKQESVWETIPQPCWDIMKYGGKNGYLDLFTGDSSYSKQFKYTDAPDADSRAVQATYDALLWSKGSGADLSSYVSKASKMGDYLRYSLFDKYFRKIGDSSVAGTGYDSAHYLQSWYYAWGGSTENTWSWKIGCSHNHFGYQNPLSAYALSTNAEMEPKSANGASDWAKSKTRQLEFYKWLQSSEGAIAGGASNSHNGRYDAWPSSTSTFYGMGYEANPVYADPGSNTWFGMQAWSMQRVAEYYYRSKDASVKALMDKWVKWVKSVVKLKSDGTFEIPSTLSWSGQPDTWTGTYTGNPNLHVTVENYCTDLGAAACLANALLYYSAASNDDSSRVLAKEMLDRMWSNYQDEKGLSVPETRADYSRFFDDIYVPSGWKGTMPNGDAIKSGDRFIDIRSKYKDDPDWSKIEEANSTGTAPTFNYHRFWAESDIALANGLYSSLFENQNNSSIEPKTAAFDKNISKQTDIEVTLSLNGNTLTGINDGTKDLVEGTDYTVSDTDVTISKNYLATLAVGTVNLKFNFSAGKGSTLVVTVTDTSPSASLEPTTAVFDKNPNSQTDIDVTITPNGNTFQSIANGATPLDEDTDYTVSDNTVTISKSYLAKQPLGTVNLSFSFSAGVSPTLKISVIDTRGNLKVKMFNSSTDPQTNGISCKIQLFNSGKQPLDLSQVEMRYYYTIDGDRPQAFFVDWASVGNDSVKGDFVTLSPSKVGADHYLKIYFDSSAGELAANQNAQIQIRFAKDNWTNYNQADDYSFNSTSTNYVDWSKVTAYISGNLVWGTEP